MYHDGGEGGRDTINCQIPGLPVLTVHEMPGVYREDACGCNWLAHKLSWWSCTVLDWKENLNLDPGPFP